MTMTGATGDWLMLLLDASVKGLAILTIAGVMTLLMRKISAAERQLVWVVAMAALLVLPVVSAALPGWQVLPNWRQAAPPATPEPAPQVTASQQPPSPPLIPAATEAPVSERTSAAPVVHNAVSPTMPAGPREMPTSSAGTIMTWVLAIWAFGAAACLAPMVLGRVSLWRLRRGAHALADGSWPALLKQAAGQLGVGRRVELLRSDRCTMPMVWGVLRARLMLPAEAADWSPQRRQIVLLHELAHVKRWDCLIRAITQLACAAYWFNPLAWLAAKRVQDEGERACDDLVLAAGNRPSDYAEHLVEISSGLQAGRLAVHSSIAMVRPAKLEGRVRAILNPTRIRRAIRRRAILIAAVLAIGIIIPLACMESKEPPAIGGHVRHVDQSAHAARPARIIEPIPEDIEAAVQAARAELSDFENGLLRDLPSTGCWLRDFPSNSTAAKKARILYFALAGEKDIETRDAIMDKLRRVYEIRQDDPEIVWQYAYAISWNAYDYRKNRYLDRRDACLEKLRALYQVHTDHPGVRGRLAWVLSFTIHHAQQEGDLSRRDALLDELRGLHKAYVADLDVPAGCAADVPEFFALGLANAIDGAREEGDQPRQAALLDELRSLHDTHDDHQSVRRMLARVALHSLRDANEMADERQVKLLSTELRSIIAADPEDSSLAKYQADRPVSPMFNSELSLSVSVAIAEGYGKSWAVTDTIGITPSATPIELPEGKPWFVIPRGRVDMANLRRELQSQRIPGLWLSRATDDDLAHLAGLKHLQWLDLSHSKITDAGLAHLKALTGLRTLLLPDCADITDTGLAHLSALTGLKRLDLRSTNITDAGLAHLQGLTDLQELDISATKITDAGLVHLAGMTHLQWLDVSLTRITDSGTAHLKGLTSLKELDISGTNITDASLAHLAAMPHLAWLDLNGTGVGNMGLAYMGNLKSLKWLNLHFTKITDDDLASLKSLKGLEQLFLYDTKITDAGLTHLAGLTSLQEVDLSDTNVTARGAEALRRSLPERATGEKTDEQRPDALAAAEQATQADWPSPSIRHEGRMAFTMPHDAAYTSSTRVDMAADGRCTISAQEFEPADTVNIVRALQQERDRIGFDARVHIRANRRVTFENVAAVLNAIDEADITRQISVVVRIFPPEPESSADQPLEGTDVEVFFRYAIEKVLTRHAQGQPIIVAIKPGSSDETTAEYEIDGQATVSSVEDLRDLIATISNERRDGAPTVGLVPMAKVQWQHVMDAYYGSYQAGAETVGIVKPSN